MTSEATVGQGLHHLCRLYGVVTRYHDALGTERTARPEALLAVLRALGAPVGEDPARTEDAIRARELELARRMLEPTSVVPADGEGAVALTHPEGDGNRRLELRLEVEGEEPREWSVRPDELEAERRREAGGRAWIRRRLPLPGSLPPGRHRLSAGPEASGWILAAPNRAFVPEPVARCRGWGVFSPVYALRSRRDQALGGLAELHALRSWVGELGGHAVGTLPLLAAFLDEPFEPSPYLPVSRLFWNELFLETEWALDEDLERMDRSALPEDPSAAVEAGAPDPEELVDYRAAARARRRALEPLARAFFQGSGQEDPDFRRFLEARPEVRSYAGFRAETEARGEAWPAWGGEPGEADPGERFPEAVRYHLYVQWLAHRQLRRVGDTAPGGPDLYLDLPLGVHPDGFDTWRRPGLFGREISVGAPPDRFFREGQDWGFPPVLPHRARAQGHAYTGACLRHSMEACGYLRVDHVMGFQRLFWIPRGMDPVEGVYVRYPARELLALTCLESRRAGTGVVGEDLGTVPPEIRREMEARGISRMHVIQFELPPAKGRAPGSVPRGAAASAGTHDTPTFAGFCRGLDLDRREAQGRLTPEEAREERQEREAGLAALRDWLVREGRIDPEETDPGPLLRAVLRHLARSPAGLVLVSLDDLWLEERPQNIPGQAGGENWRRLHRHTLPEIRELDAVTDALREIARLRGGEGGE